MIRILIEEIRTKYIYIFLIGIYICILLGVASYEYTTVNPKIGISINNKCIDLKDGLIEGKFISKEDLILNFPNNIFYDKISRKLVFTTWNNMLKIAMDDKDIVLQEGTTWYNIYSISEYFGYKQIKDVKKNNIYVYNFEELEAVVIKNRTEIYDINNLKVIGIVDKDDIVVILKNQYMNDYEQKYALVRMSDNDNNYYIGLIEKQDLEYNNLFEQNIPQEKTKLIMTEVVGKLTDNTDLDVVNALAVQMLRINSEKELIEESYTLPKNLKQDIYAVISNGYNTTNFDVNEFSNLLNSDKNKESLTKQILEYLVNNNIRGLVIDFKGYKSTDKELVEQYIKELSAVLHKNNKLVIMKANSISTYDITKLQCLVDYIIVQAHSSRTIASKTSGSPSSVTYVTEVLESFAKIISPEKIILELAPFSILWTERAGTVINAEIYSMVACEKYIKDNNIKTIFDKNSGQNIINYTRGIINYKMWIEDKESINEKVNISKDIDVGGFNIYRSGYETKDIYSILK